MKLTIAPANPGSDRNTQKKMKDSNGRFITTHTRYIADCLTPNACKNGKTRLLWTQNVLSAGDVEGMINQARHFTDVKAWRISARYIYQAGEISGHSIPLSSIEKTIIANALLAASNANPNSRDS